MFTYELYREAAPPTTVTAHQALYRATPGPILVKFEIVPDGTRHVMHGWMSE